MFDEYAHPNSTEVSNAIHNGGTAVEGEVRI